MTDAQYWGNPLLLMAKPAPDLATLLASHPRADRRSPDRLHITLLPIGPARPERLTRVIAALDDWDAPAFRVCFDGIHCSGRTVALRGSEPMRGALRFQAALRERLLHGGIDLPAYRFHPHITLRYRPDDRASEAIDAISWHVDEMLLIESVRGEGRHVTHRRWTLGTAPPPSRYLPETRCHMIAAPFG